MLWPEHWLKKIGIGRANEISRSITFRIPGIMKILLVFHQPIVVSVVLLVPQYAATVSPTHVEVGAFHTRQGSSEGMFERGHRYA